MLGLANLRSGLPYGVKVAILVAVAVAALAITLTFPPIPQDPTFHDFADQRQIVEVRHFANAFSNIGFLIVGALGLLFVLGKKARALFPATWERWPFLVCFGGVTLVGGGSTYYHLDPTTETLFWDRLPMSIAFMGLLSAFVADRIVHTKPGIVVTLVVTLAFGISGLVYGHLSEAAGQGDFRFYFLLNPAYPVLALPLICILFPGNHTNGKFLSYTYLWYGAALACEQFDLELYTLLGGAISGHTVKHVLATVAIIMMLAMLHSAASRQPPANSL